MLSEKVHNLTLLSLTKLVIPKPMHAVVVTEAAANCIKVPLTRKIFISVNESVP